MKNLKLKIAFTNIRRIITSFLFINIGVLFQNKVKGAIEVSCYIAGPSEIEPISTWDKIINFCQENVFVLIVPIAIVILLIVFGIKKIKENKKINEEVQRKMEEKNDKQN